MTFFSKKNDSNTVQLEIIFFAYPVVRTRRSLTRGKSILLKNHSEYAK